jgi:hypothetical protein
MKETPMSRTGAESAQLSIADVARGKLEHELNALGVRIVLTPLSGGRVRRWFECPNPECRQHCAVLSHVRGRLVCEACAKALKKLQQKPDASVQRKVAVSHKRPTATRTDRKPAETVKPTNLLLPPGAMRPGKPRRELVENCRRFRVDQFLDRFGLPLFDDAVREYAYRIRTFRLIMVASAPAFGGVRWWFACPTCKRRCGILYSPRALSKLELRCRACWQLRYQSQLT